RICLTASALLVALLGLAEPEPEPELEQPAVASRLAATTAVPRQVFLRFLPIFTGLFVGETDDAQGSGVQRADERSMIKKRPYPIALVTLLPLTGQAACCTAVMHLVPPPWARARSNQAASARELMRFPPGPVRASLSLCRRPGSRPTGVATVWRRFRRDGAALRAYRSRRSGRGQARRAGPCARPCSAGARPRARSGPP